MLTMAVSVKLYQDRTHTNRYFLQIIYNSNKRGYGSERKANNSYSHKVQWFIFFFKIPQYWG